jgi:branched-chain amino acid transport system substrate-binding protein
MLQGKGAEFVAAYKKQHGAEPEAYAAYGYEAAMVVLDGIKRAGVKDRAKIIEAVATTKDFEGALGRWSFDANGDTTLTTMSGNTVKNGQFEFVKILAD